MAQPNRRRRPGGRLRGFTLIDLMVAMVIIAILAGLSLVALNSARHSAREAKTRTLITKLHYVVMNKYDSYRSRRVPVNTSGMQPNDAARARLNAIRDLMRMEMPDRWSDVYDPPLVLPQRPSLSQRYLRIYNGATNASENAAAECLYMIVMAIPEAADQFHESEIGDVDNDGLPEFVDAWGTPIRFIRWPAGFYSDTGNQFYGDSDLQSGPQTLAIGTNENFQPDPFDPRKVLGEYALFPLIYSAGPDKIYDINRGLDGATPPATYAYQLNNGYLCTVNPPGVNDEIGRPMNDRNAATPFEDLHHIDNIHNHRIETGRGGGK